MLNASQPLEATRTSLHNLGVKKVKLAIDYDSEAKSLKRTVTITAEVSPEEAIAVDDLTKLNATFHADLHVEGIQGKLLETGTIAPGKVAERTGPITEPDPGDTRPGSVIDKAAQELDEEIDAASRQLQEEQDAAQQTPPPGRRRSRKAVPTEQLEQTQSPS